jgi:preprotein translocase subunit SecD
LGCPFGAFATSASCQQRFPVLHANQTRSTLQIVAIEILSAQSLSSETARLPERFSMTQAKKLIVSLVLFLLIVANLSVFAFATLPLIPVGQGNSTRLGMRLLPESKTPVTDADIEKVMAVIRSRIKKLSSISVTVERSNIQGEEFSAVLPSGIDVAQIKEALVFRGRFELKLVAKGTQIPYPTKEAAEAVAKSLSGGPYELFLYRSRPEDGSAALAGWVILEKTPVINTNDMKEVKALASPDGGADYLIDFLLTPSSAARFSKITGEHVGDSLAIVLNNEVKSAPRIDGQLHDKGQITGGFTKRGAENLAAALSSGELPHEIKIVSEKVVASK